MTPGCICMSFCVAASTIISITFYYNDIYIWHPVTQYTYIIQLYIVYVVVFQPKYQQVPNQSTEPSRTDEVTVSLVGSMFFVFFLEVSVVGSIFRWKYLSLEVCFFGSMWSVHTTSFTAKTKGWWGLWPTGQLAEQLRPWHLKRCRQCSVESFYFRRRRTKETCQGTEDTHSSLWRRSTTIPGTSVQKRITPPGNSYAWSQN